MPPGRPAGRGRGRGRGRGGVRGGKQSTAAAASDADAPPAESSLNAPEAAIQANDAVETPEQAVVTQPEAATAHNEAPPSSLPDQTTTASTDPPTTSSARAGVQRLDSLKIGKQPTSSAASPSTRGKKLSQQPKFRGRRSKEERDAAEQEAIARARARDAEVAAAQEAAVRESGRGRGGRGRGDRDGGKGGRGGYMGEAVISGPFGGGIASSAGQRYVPQQGRARFSGTRSGGSGSGVRVKREPHVKTDTDGDIAMLGMDGNIKKEQEDGGYISSDPDEAMEGPRRDVDNLIDLTKISDEDEGAPIRIRRIEHKERAVGVNTEPSSATAAELRRQADAKGGIGNVSIEDAHAALARKGKAKAKDIEVVKTEKTWKGVWQNEEDFEEGVRIKNEPVDDDVVMTSAPEAATGADPERNDAVKPPQSSPEISKKAPDKGKTRARRKPSFHDTKPALETDEDCQEWARYQSDLRTLADELGTIKVAEAPAAPVTQDAEGDSMMQDGKPNEPEATLRDKRAERVYLFQLPPIVPDLLLASEAEAIKRERPPSPTVHRTGPLYHPAPPPPTNSTKAEDASAAAAAAEDPLNPHHDPLGPRLASGRAGKLRVHQSGRATLSWGGTSLELKLGMEAQFLQDAVMARVTPPERRVTPADGGEVMAFGQVVGKFVVTPDWEEIVG